MSTTTQTNFSYVQSLSSGGTVPSDYYSSHMDDELEDIRKQMQKSLNDPLLKGRGIQIKSSEVVKNAVKVHEANGENESTIEASTKASPPTAVDKILNCFPSLFECKCVKYCFYTVVALIILFIVVAVVIALLKYHVL
jgi:hypothetical protein